MSDPLNEKIDLGVARDIQIARRAHKLTPIDKITLMKTEEFDRHLAGQHLDPGFHTQASELFDGGNAVIGDGLLHQDGSQVLISRNIGLNNIRDVPADIPEPLWSHRHLHGHGRVAQGADSGCDLFLEQGQTIKGKEDADLVVESGGRRREDKGGVGSVQRSFC